VAAGPLSYPGASFEENVFNLMAKTTPTLDAVDNDDDHYTASLQEAEQ
jgi:hypothetical protein